MFNPDDLNQNPSGNGAPNLREKLSGGASQEASGAQAMRSRIAANAPSAPAPSPIMVNSEGGAAAPGNLRDRLNVGAGQAQADARAVAGRLAPPVLTDVIAPGDTAQPVRSDLRERLAARAAAAPSAADQALRQRLGGGSIAQAAQQAAGPVARLPAPTVMTPGAATTSIDPATVFVDPQGRAAAPNAARTTMPVPQGEGAVPPSSSRALAPLGSAQSRAMVPAGPGAIEPSASRAMVPAGPGASAPPEPAAKAPSVKPPAPPVRPGVSIVNGAGDATVPNPGLRDKITVGANQAQADLKGPAARMAKNPQPTMDVGALRQQLGLTPTPPGAAAARGVPGAAGAAGAAPSEPGLIGKYAGKLLGTGEEWRQLGQKVAPVAQKVAKVAKPLAAVGGAVELGQGIAEGDMNKAGWGAADTAAGLALFTPAAPAAGAYLAGRTLYEGGKWLYDKMNEPAKPPAKPAPVAKPVQAPAAKPAATAPAKPAAKPAAQPAAAPAPAQPVAAPQPDYSVIARAARDEALGAIDNEEAARPDAIYYQTIDHNTGTTTYHSRDRNDFTVAKGAAVDEATQNRIDAYQARQGRRDSVESAFNQALEQMQAAGSGGAAPAAAPAPASAPAGRGNPRVAAFVQQYGDVARATAEKLGVDPNLVLAQWGQETGWGKSVIPGTNNLGNIKAVKGQGGVAATDNMTGSRDNYLAFNDPQQFADHYSGLLSRRYPGAVGAGSDMAKFAGALAAGGYATDPAYAAKLQAAYATLQRAGAGAAAPMVQAAAQPVLPNRPGMPSAAAIARAQNPLSNPVQVLDMGSGTSSVVFPSSNNPMAGMSQTDYEALSGAIQKNPALAQRVQVTDRGPLIDGTPVPANVVAGGDGAIGQYGRNYAQAQRFAVNPAAGKLAEEALRGEFANRGQEIAGRNQANVAQIQAAGQQKASEIAANARRYIKVDGGVNPQTGMPEGDKVFDQNTGKTIRELPPEQVALQQAQKAVAAGGDAAAINAHLQSMYPHLSVTPKKQ